MSDFENAKFLFRAAKQLENLRGPIQQISFADPFLAEDFKLLEMEPALVEAVVQGRDE